MAGFYCPESIDQSWNWDIGRIRVRPAANRSRPPISLFPTELESDRRTIAKCCWALSLIEPRPGWRTARQILRRLRAETRELLQQNWPLVVRVAEALSEHETLDHVQLAAILAGREGEAQ